MRKSSSPQLTSCRNCWIRPFFLGPRQITASFWLLMRNPIDITASYPLYTGDHPWALWWTSCPTIPNIVGILGPQISTSISPTSYFWERSTASWVATVLLPTPPFPERTTILCLMPDNFCAMILMAGFSWTAPEAQAAWLGQPEQADYLPALSELTPGQFSLALFGTYFYIFLTIIIIVEVMKICTSGWFHDSTKPLFWFISIRMFIEQMVFAIEWGKTRWDTLRWNGKEKVIFFVNLLN